MPSSCPTAARVDFYWPDHRLVVEVSGQLGHATSRERAHDARRRNELQELGLDVYEFTFEQVMDEPEVVMRAVRRRLAPLTVVSA